MTPQEHHEWLNTCTMQELVDSCIWQTVMEGTAFCGWTDRARDGLVKSVQDSVRWAIEQKTTKQENT